jgi:hypothetical protein
LRAKSNPSIRAPGEEQTCAKAAAVGNGSATLACHCNGWGVHAARRAAGIFSGLPWL